MVVGILHSLSGGLVEVQQRTLGGHFEWGRAAGASVVAEAIGQAHGLGDLGVVGAGNGAGAVALAQVG
jgi:hypothetical protein